jgi:hypothetical protein
VVIYSPFISRPHIGHLFVGARDTEITAAGSQNLRDYPRFLSVNAAFQDHSVNQTKKQKTMKALNLIVALAITTLAAASAKEIEIRNDLDFQVSFVLKSAASNETQFSRSGTVAAKQTITINIPDDAGSLAWKLDHGNQTTGWIHGATTGLRPEHVDFSGGTWHTK